MGARRPAVGRLASLNQEPKKPRADPYLPPVLGVSRRCPRFRSVLSSLFRSNGIPGLGTSVHPCVFSLRADLPPPGWAYRLHPLLALVTGWSRVRPSLCEEGEPAWDDALTRRGYLMNLKSAEWVVPSTSLRSSRRQVPAHALSVFQT